MTSIAAIIIGIGGWQQYTLPLLHSLECEHACEVVVVDNASPAPYVPTHNDDFTIVRTARLCYSAAINVGKSKLDEYRTYDWYIVLSNDVLCTGPFAAMLRDQPPCVAGPQLWQEHGLSWIVGWCVCIHRTVWDALGGWDEGYLMSSWEDVDTSVTAVERGYSLVHLPTFPFVHLDQRQRFTLPGYSGSEDHNMRYFRQKHRIGWQEWPPFGGVSPEMTV